MKPFYTATFIALLLAVPACANLALPPQVAVDVAASPTTEPTDTPAPVATPTPQIVYLTATAAPTITPTATPTATPATSPTRDPNVSVGFSGGEITGRSGTTQPTQAAQPLIDLAPLRCAAINSRYNVDTYNVGRKYSAQAAQIRATTGNFGGYLSAALAANDRAEGQEQFLLSSQLVIDLAAGGCNP